MGQSAHHVRTTGEAAPALLAGLARGRARFNRAEFWSSHEAFESAWQRADAGDRALLKGLIKAGAAFHKLVVQDRPGSARRLIEASLAHLAPYPEDHLGLALRPFRAQLQAWLGRLEPAAALAASIPGLPRLDWSFETRFLDLDAIEIHELELDGRRATLVGLESGGLRGWGECRQPWDHHGLWTALIRGLLPALLTEQILHPSELPILSLDISDDAFAAAGVEMALWDLWSRQRGLSLGEAMGIAPRALPLAGRVRQLDPTRMRAEIQRLCDLGYRHLVLPARPNSDRRILPALVAELDRPWSVDMGGAYQRADIQVLEALAVLGPSWLADPMHATDPSGAQRLRAGVDIPLARGGWRTAIELEGAIRLALMDLALVDPMACGLSEAIEMADIALARGLPMGLGCKALTPVGAAALTAFGAHPALGLPADLGPVLDFAGQAYALPDAKGMLAPAGGPASDTQPNAAWLGRHASRQWRIEA